MNEVERKRSGRPRGVSKIATSVYPSVELHRRALTYAERHNLRKHDGTPSAPQALIHAADQQFTREGIVP